MRYSLGAAQRAYDNRQPPEWEPEPDTSIKCERAIDQLKSAVRGFCNDKEPEGFGSVEDAIYTLLDNPEIEKRVIGAVRSHMSNNCFVEAL